MRLVGQDQGLAGQDLAAGIGDDLAVDADQPFGDQGLGLAPRADPALGQPLVDPLGLGLFIASGEGHGGSP